MIRSFFNFGLISLFFVFLIAGSKAQSFSIPGFQSDTPAERRPLIKAMLPNVSLPPLTAPNETATPPSIAPKEFDSSKLSNPSLCNHIIGLGGTSELSLLGGEWPPMFGDVKNVYVYAASTYPGLGDYIPVFKPQNLAGLAACKFQRDFDGKVFIFPNDNDVVGEANAQQSAEDKSKLDHNLMIYIYAGIQDGYGNLFQAHRKGAVTSLTGRIVMVTLTYYRHDVHNFLEETITNCSKAFIYPQSGDILQRRMKNAIQECVFDPFWTN